MIDMKFRIAYGAAVAFVLVARAAVVVAVSSARNVSPWAITAKC